VTNNVTTAAVANYDFGGSDEHAFNVPVQRPHNADFRQRLPLAIEPSQTFGKLTYF
jgi:hypothetical protein